MNEGHLCPVDCQRNADACRASQKAALSHAERHSSAGQSAEAKWWNNYAEQVNIGVAYWEAKAKECDPVGNPLECDTR